ncbi:MAG: CpsD/CapB family tyrosine-protein kinase [Vicinamibacterales bacterium]
MGRVEEALRRAAEGANVESTGTTAADDTQGGSFPAELPAEGAAAEMSSANALAGAFPGELADGATHARPTLSPSDDPVGDAVLATPAGLASEGKHGGSNDASVRLSTKLVGDDRMLVSSREQYRRLAATLHHLQATSGLKVILVASAVAGEGKTLTAANLALTFSESYQKEVLLIDADLRRPSLARTFNIPGEPGLSEGLMPGHEGPLPLQHVSSRLTVLPGGRATSDPMAGLTSQRMRQLIAEARQTFDWVIIDTPPIGLMSDANLLSAIADGSVLVVKANSTPYHLVRRAVDALGEGHLLGAVLNRAAVPAASKYYDYYHYAPVSEGSSTR